MIQFSVCYPFDEQAKFDKSYYQQSHAQLVREKMQGAGLQKVEMVFGQPGFDGTPPTYIARANLYFASMNDLKTALKAAGADLMADLKNYTDIQPIQEISEVAIEA